MRLDHNSYKTKRANFLPSLEGSKERPTRVQSPGPPMGIFRHPEKKNLAAENTTKDILPLQKKRYLSLLLFCNGCNRKQDTMFFLSAHDKKRFFSLLLQVKLHRVHNTEAESKEIKRCMGPYAGIDNNLTLCLLQSLLQHIYHGH